MKFTTFYLAFNSPLHLGNHKPESYEQSEEYIRSDTIVAAVYSAWAEMGHSDWIPSDGQPPFVVSSAFPYVKKEDNEYVHFFPRPKVRFNYVKGNFHDNILRKKIKKIRWLDQFYFEKVINFDEISNFGETNEDLKGIYLCREINPEYFITKDLLQRVTVSRNVIEVKDSEPFYMERIFFHNAGLYFVATGTELGKLRAALEFLQYEGFGTDRSVGNGFFHLSEGSIDIGVPANTDLSTNISLYIPETKDEFISQISHHNAAFDAVKRGGWITTMRYHGKEKKSIFMFSEGGVWKISDVVSGKGSVDLRPSTLAIDHPVWRCGRSLFIPLKIN